MVDTVMLDDTMVAELERQQYRIVGKHRHSAVKVCGWTKNLLRGKGGCYKYAFYGIKSHQCLQMTTSMSCANRCVFCWRGYKAPVSKEWIWGIDDPEEIIEGALHEQKQLLYGFGGDANVKKELYEETHHVRHVALSLSGEPIAYPRINEIISSFHRRGISTFLVTNAQYPTEIRNLAPVTQLYLSLDAPDPVLFKKVDVPLFPDYWERFLSSLDALASRSERTAVRFTLVKGLNMTDPAGYAKLIERADPDFVEAKAYMFVGASRQRLTLAHMPLHEEVQAFAKELETHLPGYAIAGEHKPSRIVLLAKKKYHDEKTGRWDTWIDFDRFFALWKEYDAGARKEIVAEEYTTKRGFFPKAKADVVVEEDAE
jgi:tRNA wybutosine-synthesizing protein 1